MELFGVAITLLSAILTYQAWKNGRWMKAAHQDTLSLLEKIEKGHEEARKEATEGFRRMDETHREIAQKTDETLREIARLIVAEGERTRQAITPR